MKAEGIENKNSLLAICRSSEAAGGARSNCHEFFGSFCRYKKNEEKLLAPAANDNPELFQHYFNANHLGSGSLITDESGATYQTLAYAPHGEILVNDFAGDYDEPYKFTGYERDQESGLDYAHARYREPDKTIFYSTDPMWFKYPHITPYNYAGNNPSRFIDPDGRGVFPSAAELRKVGTAVVNNKQYEKKQTGTKKDGTPKYETYCNLGARAINAKSGNNIPNDEDYKNNANKMGKYLRNPDNATSISQQQALDYANQGVVVFASYVNPNPDNSGHVAVVAPTEGMTYSSQRGENVVSVFNVGLSNGEITLAQAFGKLDVGFYILNSDLETIKSQIQIYNGGDLQEVLIVGQNGTNNHNVPLLTIEPIKTDASTPKDKINH